MKNKAAVIFTLLAIIALGYVSYSLGNRSDVDLTLGNSVKYPSTPLTLTYWRTIDEAAALEPIIADYKKLHPNVEVQLVVVPPADYAAKLSAAAGASQLPDIFSVAADQVATYKKYAASAPKSVFDAKSYQQTFAAQANHDLVDANGPFALTYGISTLGLFYNDKLLREAGVTPPKNWQEAVSASAKLTRKSGAHIERGGIALGTPAVAHAVDIESALMLQNGAKMTDQPPTKAVFDQPDSSGYLAGVKAAQFYASFATPGKSNYSWSDSLGGSVDAFAHERVAMIVDFPYRAGEIRALNPALSFKSAALPQVDGKNLVNLGDYWAEMVNNTSTNSEIAWDFLRFASSKDQLNKYSIATSRPASRLDLAKAQETDTLLGPFAAQVSSATNWVRGSRQNCEAIFTDMNTAIVRGYDAALAVRSAAARVSQEIGRAQK